MRADPLSLKQVSGLNLPPVGAPAKRRAEFFWRLERLCPVCALQVQLMEAFGLNVGQVVDLEPVKADAGDRLVLHGADGLRFVRIVTAEQRELLEAAKAAVDERGLVRAAAGRDSRQACRRLRFFVAAAAGRRPHPDLHEHDPGVHATGLTVLFTSEAFERREVSRSALL